MRGLEVEEVLIRVLNSLKERGIDLESPRKRSHEDKQLIEHVTECWRTADALLERLGLSENELKLFCFSLCITHDIGKLDPRWRIRTRGRLRHAERGAELLQEIKEELASLLHLPENYQIPLIFAVLRHHSPLFLRNMKEARCLGKPIRDLLTVDGEVDVRLAVSVADTIGIFKLADIISASSFISLDLLLKQYEWPKCFDAKIEDGIKHKAENKCGFNLEKYNRQSELARSYSRHLVLVAPTGWGKTALALLRARYLKPMKVLYILPTITAIKEFREDLERIFGQEYVGEYFYFSDVEDLIRRKSEEGAEYITNFYRYFVPKVIVTTIDQLLLAGLQFGRYHLRRFNLRKALIVLDEFHLLTPEMVGALGALFESLADIYEFSVLLMSATPSELYINVLREVLERQGVRTCVLKPEYERLKRHRVECVDVKLCDFIREKTDTFKGERILVMCNTVDRAAQVYDLLEGSNIRLIHGRFAYKDRANAEARAGDAEILVSTQVAEVSLDISFDILVTEEAPIPSLIQRFGRVNRYGERPVEGTNVYICEAEDVLPYSPIDTSATREILPKLEDAIKKEGESAYLKILDEYSEILLMKNSEKKIRNMWEKAREELCCGLFFYYFEGRGREALEMLGREPSCLAVPNYYRNQAVQLRRAMHGKSFEERRKLMARMKEYFVSVPLNIVREDGEWDDDLNLYVVGINKYSYTPERGLLKTR